MRKVSSGLFSNSFTCSSKLVTLARPKIKIWVFMKPMWPVKVSRTSRVVLCWFFLDIYNCCLKYGYLSNVTISSWPNNDLERNIFWRLAQEIYLLTKFGGYRSFWNRLLTKILFLTIEKAIINRYDLDKNSPDNILVN